MRDIDKRIERLEATMGNRRCVCERNQYGYRIFVSVFEKEVEAAQRRFDECPADHPENDRALVVLIKTYSPECLARGYTGIPPRKSV
jgi:hypothetical protein